MFFGILTILLAAFTGVYILLLLFLRIKLGKHSLQTNKQALSVSVIIPVRNEENHLPGLFKSLANQTYKDEQTEFIFINDRSTDNTGSLLQEFCNTHPHARYIEIDLNGSQTSPKKYALQQGISAAAHDIILTTDGDCIHPPTWIASMITSFADDVSMVLGYAPYSTDGIYSSMFHRILAFDYMAMGTISIAGIESGYPITSFGGNLAFRKKDFELLGGYGESIKFISGDDDLLVHKFAEKASGRVVFNSDPGSFALNPPPRSFRDFIRQRLRFSSKHLAYPGVLLGMMWLVYLFNILLLTGLVYTLFNPGFLLPALLSLILKGSADILLLIKGRELLRERSFLHLYPLAAVPHLFYVVFIPLFAQLRPQRW